MVDLAISDIALLFCLGSVGSFIAGFLGVGGGIIYVPILDYFLWKLGYRNEELVRAILANSLFTIMFAGAVSLFNQYKLDNFYPKQILYAALPAAFSVWIVTYFINSGTWYSKAAFNYVFIILLLFVIVRMYINRKSNNAENPIIPMYQFSIVGFLTGIISALSGLGGGIILTPALTDIMKQPLKMAISVSNGVIPLLALSVSIYNFNQIPATLVSTWQVGYIIFPLVLPMMASSFVFAPIGVKLSHRTPSSNIKIVFLVFALIVLIKNAYEILHLHQLL